MNKKSIASALALAWLAWAPLGAAAIQPVFQISNLNFNHAMLFNMVNSAIANNGAINNFNAGTDGGVVGVTIRNVGSVAGYCYVIPIVKQAGNGQYNCYNGVAGGTVATGPLLQTTTMIQPGQTLQANIGSFELAGGDGGFNGGLCQNLQNLVSNNFGGNSNNSNGGSGSASSALSAAGGVVHELLQLQMSVCLVNAYSNGSPVPGSNEEACTQIAVFAQPPSVLTSAATLIYPNNTSIASPLPSFIWTPALYQGSSLGLQYQLVISQSRNGNPWYGVLISSGQTFYQYQATDRALQTKEQYYWHVVALNSSQQPVGGQSGQGWNQPQGTFTYAPMGPTGFGEALVTLRQLGNLVSQNASPAVLRALAGMQIESAGPLGTLSNPDVAALVAKPTEIKNISVVKF
jgi:hypothetical protein